MTSAWDEIVPLPENRLARKAVRQLAHQLTSRHRCTSAFTPLFLHGSPGTGKTLLIQSLVRRLTAGSLAFTARTIAAHDLGRLTEEEDSHDWRSVDLLAIEDLQHLPDWARSDLCQLLDQRASRRMPTVITADGGPALLPGFTSRLSSRLCSGLVLGLENFSTISRARLVRGLAQRRQVPLTLDAIRWLAASRSSGGARSIIGALETLRTVATPAPQPLDRTLVRSLLSEPVTPKRASLETILARVAEAFQVKAKELQGASRLPMIQLPRQVAMYLLRQHQELSLEQIGAAFGGRDHTTVRHAILKIQKTLQSDLQLAGIVRELQSELT